MRTSSDVIPALFDAIPSGRFIVSAAHDGYRAGILSQWVQPCSNKPPLVMLAIRTGLPIEPVIRDSRGFALSLLPEEEVLLARRFETPHDRTEDPFVTVPHVEAPSGAPIPDRAVGFLDCQMVRQLDLEADHRLYVGKVLHAFMIPAEPGRAERLARKSRTSGRSGSRTSKKTSRGVRSHDPADRTSSNGSRSKAP